MAKRNGPAPIKAVSQPESAAARIAAQEAKATREAFKAYLPGIEAAEKKRAAEAKVAELAKLDSLEYDLKRKETAKDLELPVGRLDKHVAHEREGGARHEIAISKIVPWPEPVPEGAALLDEIVAAFNRHFSLPSYAAEAIALWIMHTHCLPACTHTPRLALTSPVEGCGKSNALKLIKAMVPDVLLAAIISAPAVYRTITNYKPTLLLDELDKQLANNMELQTIVNGGHARGEEVIKNVKAGNDWEPGQFNIFAPIALAKIGGLPKGPVASRCIHIRMQRLLPHEERELFDDAATPKAYVDLGRKCATWARDNMEALSSARPAMADLKGRSRDNWRILFNIAQVAGRHWPSHVREAAASLIDATAVRDIKVQALADIRAVFETHGMIDLPSEMVVQEMVGLPDRPWVEYRHGRALTQTGLARLLVEFGVQVSPDRVDDPRNFNKRLRGYQAAQFADLWERYLS